MTMADALFDCYEEVMKYQKLFPAAYESNSEEIEEVKQAMKKLQVRLDRGDAETVESLNKARKER